MREVNDGSTARSITNVGTTGEQRSFSIGANAYAFRTLVDGLYSDKVGSVIREIIANAVDAHAIAKKAGQTPSNPIKVILPSMFHKTFAVRDFGPGMPHNFVMEQYSTLFHSEKKRTNVATGMFGLGAKSPFAISDQFEVRTYTMAEGAPVSGEEIIERVYAMFINEEGIPTVELKGSYVKPAATGTGVLVSVPVPDRRVTEFDTAIVKQSLAFFDQDIKFSRLLSGQREEPMTAIRRNIEKLCNECYLVRNLDDGSSRWGQGSLFIRQGTAVYPLEINRLSVPHERMQTLDLLRRSGTNILFDAPIGSFNVTPSREAVAYDPASCAALLKIVITGIEGAITTWQKKYAGLSTMWEYIKRTAEHSHGRDAKGRLKMAGIEAAFGIKDMLEVMYRRVHKKGGEHVIMQAMVDNLPVGSKLFTTNFRAGASIYGFSNGKRANIRPTTQLFVISTNCRNWENRVQLWLTENCEYDCSDTHIEVVVARIPRGSYPLGDLTKLTAWPTSVVLEADLPEPKDAKGQPVVVVPPVRKRYAKTDVYKLINSSITISGYKWDDAKSSADPAFPAYYVVRDGSKPECHIATAAERAKAGVTKAFLNNTDVGALVKAGRAAGLIDSRPIYRITPVQAGQLSDMGFVWTDLTTCFLSEFDMMIGEVETANRKDLLSRLRFSAEQEFCLMSRRALNIMQQPTKVPANARQAFLYQWDVLDSAMKCDATTLLIGLNLGRPFVPYTAGQGTAIPEAEALTKPSPTIKAYAEILKIYGKDGSVAEIPEADSKAQDALEAKIDDMFPLLRGARPSPDENDLFHRSLYIYTVLSSAKTPALISVIAPEYKAVIAATRDVYAKALVNAKKVGTL